MSFAAFPENPRIRPFSTIGGAIKHFRVKANMTQLELADNIGVTQSAVSRFESCSATPSIKTLIKMSRCLGCPVQALAEHKYTFVE